MAIEHREERDEHGRNRLIITKPRGRLAVEEIEEYLRSKYYFCGRVWLLLLCPREDSYQGWDSGQDPKGDAAILYEYEDASYCPLCGEQVNYGDDYEAREKELKAMEYSIREYRVADGAKE